MKQINLNRILKSEGSLALLQGKIQLQENVPVAKYRLTSKIRHEVWNYKETAQSIIVVEISFST